MRADHSPANVFGIAETAQCHRLELRRTPVLGQFQGDSMLPQTAVDVASWKTQIAAQKMNAGLLGGEMMPLSRRLGFLKIGLRSGELIGHALHRGPPGPSPATVTLIGLPTPARLARPPRLGHGSEIAQDSAMEAGQCETVGPVAGQCEAALD